MTRRDVGVAVVTVACTLGLSTWARSQGSQPAVMGSSAWDFASLTATPTKVGEVRKVFQAPTATLDELECHITTLNPGETPHAPHKHPDEEVLVLKEGTIEAIQDGKTIRVGPGSVVFQASNQLHSVRNVGTTPATYIVLKWNSPGMLKKNKAASGE
jgi:XRE family transcriptional regulator, regulator of sulfur utilization